MNIRRLFLVALFLMIGSDAFNQSRVFIIPKPASVIEQPESFSYSSTSVIYYDNRFKDAAKLLGELMKIPGRNIRLLSSGKPKAKSSVILNYAGSQKDSGAYKLTIDPLTIRIAASNPLGALYGVQSVAQMIMTAEAPSSIPCAIINDKPSFGYRGFMLDVSRHFFPPAFVKKLIDLLSLYKMNRLHLHLTDAAGWRLQINKYLELTTRAAWRSDRTWKEWSKNGMNYSSEGSPMAYGGYYTQDDARDLVAYAAKKGITIVPEIEMPGHSDEVIAAYPQLGCLGVNGRQGEFCIGTDSTFIFMQDVLTEVMAIFPSSYIHIGGDEASTEHWKKCSRCQKRMKDNNLKNEKELQSYAIKRMEKYISSKGRKLLGWDEILEGGLAPGATVMSWRSEQGGIEAARMNHDVIMTPGSYCYFDYYQQDPLTQPEAIGGFVPLKKVYSYNPIPAALESSKQQFIRGAQANLWTEYIPTVIMLNT